MQENKKIHMVYLLIIIALIVGGILYFTTKRSTLPLSQNINPVLVEDTSPQIVSVSEKVATSPSTLSTCESNTPPSLTITSPNGGETYARGQQVAVTWTSCNVADYIAVLLNVDSAATWNQGNPIILASGAPDGPTPNDGNETFTLPSSLTPGQYKLWIRHEYDDYTGDAYQDQSDGSFTIN